MRGIPLLIHAEKDRVYQLVIELATALVTAQPDDVLEYALAFLRGQVASKEAPRVLVFCEDSATAEELARKVALQSGLLLLSREDLHRRLKEEKRYFIRCRCDKCDAAVVRCVTAALKKARCLTGGYVTAGLPWDAEEVAFVESELVVFTHLVHVTGSTEEVRAKRPFCPRHPRKHSDYKIRLKALLKHFESKVVLSVAAENQSLDDLAAECKKKIFAPTLIAPFYKVKWKPRVVIFGADLTRPEWFAERLCQQYGMVYVDMEALVLSLAPERRACANRVELVEARVSQWDCVMAGWVLVGGPKDAEEMSRLDSGCCKPNRIFLMKADIDWLLFRVDGGRFFRKHEGTSYRTYLGEAQARPAIFQETFGYLDRLKGMQQYCGASAVALDCEKALQERYKDMVLRLQLAPPVAAMRSGVAPSGGAVGDYASRLDRFAPAWAPELHDAPSADAVVFSNTKVLVLDSDESGVALKEPPEAQPPEATCAKALPNVEDSIRALVADLRQVYGESGKEFKLALQRKLTPQLKMLMDKVRLSGAGPELLRLFPAEAQLWSASSRPREQIPAPEQVPGGQWIRRQSRPRRRSVEVQPPSPRKEAEGAAAAAEDGPKLTTPRYQPRAEGTQDRRERAERLKRQRMPLETSGFPLTSLRARMRRLGREYVPDKPQPPARGRPARAEQEFWYLSSPYHVSNRNVLFSVYNKVVGGTDYVSDALARQLAPLGPPGQPCFSALTRCVISETPSQGSSSDSDATLTSEDGKSKEETPSVAEQHPCPECVITYERERQRPLDEEHHAHYKLPRYIDQRTQEIVSHVGQHQKPFIPNSEGFYPALTGDEPVITQKILPNRSFQKPTAPQMSLVFPAGPEAEPQPLESRYRKFSNEPGNSIHYIVPPEGVCSARHLRRHDSLKIRPDKIEDTLKDLPTELAPRKMELGVKRADIVKYEISKLKLLPESPLVHIAKS